MTETTSGSRSDGELLAGFAARRDDGAFAEVVRRHGGMVLSVCRSVLGNTSDAEDAAQAVFLTLAQKSHSSSVQHHVVGWLHKVAWYVAARGAAAKATRRRHEREAALMTKEAVENDGTPVELDVLHAGLAALPQKYREALILHHLEGRSHAETAARLGCSVEAVAVRLHRGREMMRQRLEKRGVCASVACLAGAWGAPAMFHLPPVFATSVAAAAQAASAGAMATAVSGQTLAYVKGAMNMLFWEKMKVAATVAGLALVAGGVVGSVLMARGAGAAGAEHTVTAPGPAATQSSVITGVITAAGTEAISIYRQNGETVVVPLDAGTVIKVNGAAATAADIKLRMEAAAFVAAGKPATEVRAFTPGAARPAK